MKIEIKPNIIANIVNHHFLGSEYIGKDWEEIRKSLILELNEETDRIRKEEREGIRAGLFKQFQDTVEDIKELQIKVSSLNSEYINKLPQIQILDEVLEIIERKIKYEEKSNLQSVQKTNESHFGIRKMGYSRMHKS